MVKSSLLMDFSLAKHLSVTTCHCEVLVIQGKQFHFSQVTAPGYVGCGSEIHIQKNDKPHSGDVIPCYGGTTVSGLREGNTLEIKLMKHNAPYDVQYCYRLDISNTFVVLRGKFNIFTLNDPFFTSPSQRYVINHFSYSIIIRELLNGIKKVHCITNIVIRSPR